MVIEDMKAQICISKYFWPLIFLVIIILIIYTTRLFFLASDFCTTSAGNGGKKLHYKMTNITKRYNDDGGKNQDSFDGKEKKSRALDGIMVCSSMANTNIQNLNWN
ncbi:uncharacterized protein [Euphorbia lathyris]|uniref:uncharacterized protein isoform X3 n=1 Tax=Euphorbia lathyris TaxID=212925 RepID=UPI0033131570